MKKNKTINKVGIICSIVQIIVSAIGLIYNIVTGHNCFIWIILLSSGVCILSSNIIISTKIEK